jgi:hypothetical protein
LVLAGAGWAALPGNAIAKCPLAEYVVTGTLDLPQEVKRVGIPVFLDEAVTSPLVQFEGPVVHFALPVRFSTFLRLYLFGHHDCSRRPRHVELVVTDGERMTSRRRFSEKDFAIEDESDFYHRINLGHIKLRAPG